MLTIGDAPPAPAGDPDHRLGIVDFQNLPGGADLGSRWSRMPAEWVFIEPEDGVFNWSSGLASWITTAETLGIRPSVVVKIGQMWASGFPDGDGSAPSYPPVDLTLDPDPVFAYSESYYDFIASFVQVYGDRIDRITIENEVNVYGFWVGTMDEYRRVLATARKAIDDHAPHVLLFDSGLGSGSWGAAIAEWMIRSGDYSSEEVLAFANDYYEYDVYAPFEWTSYAELLYWLWQPFVQESNKHVNYVLATAPAYVDGLNFKFTESSWLLPTVVGWMDDRMAEHGHTLPLKVNNEASNWEREDDDDEGRNLFRMVVRGLSLGVEQSLWFPYSNQIVSTPRRGLLDEAGDPTAQSDAFETLSAKLGGDRAFASTETLGNVHRFRFSRAGDLAPSLDIMWWDNGEHGLGVQTVTVDLPPLTEEVRRTNFDGTGVINIPVSGDSLTTAVSYIPRIYEYVTSTVDVPVDAAGPGPRLGATVPNPFHLRTTIPVFLPEAAGDALVRIFDPSGRQVRELTVAGHAAGPYQVIWDGRSGAGRSLPSGVYATALVIDGQVVETRSTILLR
jgi:hypothetical protein